MKSNTDKPMTDEESAAFWEDHDSQYHHNVMERYFPDSVQADLTLNTALEAIGNVAWPSKMPCPSWGTNARDCITGSKLRTVANSVCSKCYALKGHYTQPNVTLPRDARAQAILKPGFARAMSYWLRATKQTYFRLYDSGDLQSLAELETWSTVATLCPKVKFWLPTKERMIVRQYISKHGRFPRNLNVRLSAYMFDEDLTALGTFARRHDCTISGASAKGQETCPSHGQGNKCLDCRNCWSRKQFSVVYRKH